MTLCVLKATQGEGGSGGVGFKMAGSQDSCSAAEKPVCADDEFTPATQAGIL